MTIEERIQDLRKRKGLSQEQLADVLGVSRQAVSKWEGGQSLPELEKLIAMSDLFEVTTDYILKGTTQTTQSDGKGGLWLGSQIVSAVAVMMLAVAILASFGQIDTGLPGDIYGGLVIESVGVMLIIIGFFLAGGRILSKPLFVVNVLLAGVLPSLLIPQLFFGIKVAAPFDVNTTAGGVFISLISYMVMCGTILYLGILRKK